MKRILTTLVCARRSSLRHRAWSTAQEPGQVQGRDSGQINNGRPGADAGRRVLQEAEEPRARELGTAVRRDHDSGDRRQRRLRCPAVGVYGAMRAFDRGCAVRICCRCARHRRARQADR